MDFSEFAFATTMLVNVTNIEAFWLLNQFLQRQNLLFYLYN